MGIEVEYSRLDGAILLISGWRVLRCGSSVKYLHMYMFWVRGVYK